jgi:hypothetical protein
VDGTKQQKASKMVKAYWSFGFLAVLLFYYFVVGFTTFHTGMDGNEKLLLLCLTYIPLAQLIRLPLLKWLLAKSHWESRVWIVIAISWSLSLSTGAFLVHPLVNLRLRSVVRNTLFAIRELKGYDYEQLDWNGWEFGIPDYFAALILAILVDILVLWAFNSFRKPTFKPSLRVALIVNAGIYIPVTLLFLMPYFAHKLGR